MTIITTGQIVANLVILSRASEKSKAALLIEGPKDARFYKKVINPGLCRLFAAGNRDIATHALGILKARGEKGILAIVDADTDHLSGLASTDSNLLLTHTRDSEGIILESTSLRDVLIEFDLDAAFGPEPEVAAIRTSASVGIAKYIVDQKKWQVRTSALDFSKFVDPSNLGCDHGKLCSHLADLTISVGVKASDYESELAQILNRGHDPSRIARGHDTTSLLAWAISARGGKKKKVGAKITGDVVESYLRAAYPSAAFEKCELFERIVEWESKNDPYRILMR